MKDIFQVIKTIQLSEKATLLNEQNNEYVFKVDRNANKLEIKQAVEIASRLKREVNDQFKKSKKHRGLLEIDIDGVF